MIAPLRQPQQCVAPGGERREINVLRMAGKTLHRNRKHADQAPGQPARSEPLVDGEKQQFIPRNGEKKVEVSSSPRRSPGTCRQQWRTASSPPGSVKPTEA